VPDRKGLFFTRSPTAHLPNDQIGRAWRRWWMTSSKPSRSMSLARLSPSSRYSSQQQQALAGRRGGAAGTAARPALRRHGASGEYALDVREVAFTLFGRSSLGWS